MAFPSFRKDTSNSQLSNSNVGHIFQVDLPPLEVKFYMIMHFSIEYCNMA